MMHGNQRSVNVRRIDLLNKLKENRATHALQLKKANDGFQDHLLNMLGSLLEQAKRGEVKLTHRLGSASNFTLG